MKFLLFLLCFFPSAVFANVTISNCSVVNETDSHFQIGFMANGTNNLVTDPIQRKGVTVAIMKAAVDAKALQWEASRDDSSMDAIKAYMVGKTWTAVTP